MQLCSVKDGDTMLLWSRSTHLQNDKVSQFRQ